MDDLISRQAAIDAILEMNTENRVSWLDCALDTLDALPSAEPRWIPVTERLPGYGEKVLVTFHNKYIDRTTIGVSSCYVQKEGFFSDTPFDYAPIAWMPLPEPWKGED